MRYLALACDYDGTIATHGQVDPETMAALRRLRASGRRLLLVTGRELDDLGLPERPAFFQRMLPQLLEHRARTGRPHRVMHGLIALGDDVDAIAGAFAGTRTDLPTAAPPRPDRPGRWACLFRTGAAPVWIDVRQPKQERQRHRRKYAEGERARQELLLPRPRGTPEPPNPQSRAVQPDRRRDRR